MNADDVEGRVRSVLVEVFGLEAKDVGPNTSPDTVDGWDSLHQLTVVLSLEEEFGIQFDDQETLSLLNFPLITAVVREHLGLPENP